MATKKKTTKRKPTPKRKRKAAPRKTPATKKSSWAAAFAPREFGERRYWLVKTEPDVFSFDDLLRKHNKTTHWDGVRNFVARNFMRDGMKLGDRVFFYHSSNGDPGIVGICEVMREAYPDPAQFDPASDYYEKKATKEKPYWFMVDLRAVAQLTHPVTLTAIKARKELKHMALLRIGRLSVTPVSLTEWNVITQMAESL
jgi:predicted RNA-binding protein with PUA-like domain